MRRLTLVVAASTMLLTACLPRQASLPSAIPPVSGDRRTLYALEYIDVIRGSGAEAEPRKCVYAHYTGWLHDGRKFDSSRDTMPNGSPRTPIAFPLGSSRVILGWDTGFEGMRVGGQRRLFIPQQLAYRERERGIIPARAPLIFDVELVAVADTLPRSAMLDSNAPPACADWNPATGRPGT